MPSAALAHVLKQQGIKVPGSGLPTSLVAPLTHSLIPRKIKEGTYNFVRDSASTVIDHEGLVRLTKFNEARFQGTRRVENLWPTVELNDTNTWLQAGSVTATDQGDDSYLIEGLSGFTETNSLRGIISKTSVGNNVWTASIEAKAAVPADIGKTIHLKFRYAAGGTATTATITLTEDFTRYGLIRDVSLGAVDDLIFIIHEASTGTPASQCILKNPQMEHTTGQTNQAPGEYVSKGVGTGPNLTTDPELDGSDTTATGSDNDDWSWSTSSWQISGGVLSGAALTACTSKFKIKPNRPYRLRYELNTDITFIAGTIGGASLTEGDSTALQDGVHDFVVYAGSANDYVTFLPAFGSTFNEILYFYIEEIDHGTNTDGVKYFTTENGNSVTDNIVIEALGAVITTDGYLSEPEKANAIFRSEELDDAVWTENNIQTVAASDTFIASIPAFKLIASDTSSDVVKTLYQTSVAKSGSATITLQALMRAGDCDYGFIRCVTDSELLTQFFNLSTGAVGTAVNGATLNVLSQSITPVNDGYLCTMTIETGVALVATAVVGFCLADNDPDFIATSAINPLGEVTAVQCEENSFSTSYIPTLGAAATRDADELSYDIANINTAEGALSLIVQSIIDGSDYAADAYVLKGASGETDGILVIDSTTGAFKAINGAVVAISTVTAQQDTKHQVAVSWSDVTGELTICVDGETPVTATTFTGFSLTEFNIGDGVFFGNVHEI